MQCWDDTDKTQDHDVTTAFTSGLESRLLVKLSDYLIILFVRRRCLCICACRGCLLFFLLLLFAFSEKHLSSPAVSALATAGPARRSSEINCEVLGSKPIRGQGLVAQVQLLEYLSSSAFCNEGSSCGQTVTTHTHTQPLDQCDDEKTHNLSLLNLFRENCGQCPSQVPEPKCDVFNLLNLCEKHFQNTLNAFYNNIKPANLIYVIFERAEPAFSFMKDSKHICNIFYITIQCYIDTLDKNTIFAPIRFWLDSVQGPVIKLRQYYISVNKG